MSIRSLLVELADVRQRLSAYGIRDESGYAEMLVAKALNGKRHDSGVERGSDIDTPEYGKVEVRSRTLPLDGRKEARLNLPGTKRDKFDWFAGVVFNSDLSVKEAFLLPHDVAWKCASLNKRGDITAENARKHSEYRVLPRLREVESEFDA